MGLSLTIENSQEMNMRELRLDELKGVEGGLRGEPLDGGVINPPRRFGAPEDSLIDQLVKVLGIGGWA